MLNRLRLKPLATLREIAMVHGLPRLPDERAARPDRGHVEQPGEATFYADKPPEKTLVRERPVASPPVAPAPVAALPPTEKQPRKKRHHTLDFKLMAIERVRQGESQASVARDLDIHQTALSQWCRGEGLRKHGHAPEPILIEREREMATKGKTPQTFTDAKRKSVIAQVLAGKKTYKQIAEENGVPEGTLSSWMHYYRRQNGEPLRNSPTKKPTSPSNGAPPPAEAGSALDRLLESKLESRLDALIEAKLVQMLEKKLGG